MTSREYNERVQMIKSFPKNTDQTIQEKRSDFEQRSAMLPIAEGIVIEPVRIGDMNAKWLKPDEVPNGSVILFIHGGGYCVGSVNTHRSMASYIAAENTKEPMISSIYADLSELLPILIQVCMNGVLMHGYSNISRPCCRKDKKQLIR